MSEKRIPLWKTQHHEAVPLRRHWFAAVVLGAICVAGIFYHYASRLSDDVLFLLKLVSFALTALLGVVGVVSDFKDNQKNLTSAGKLNLAGLVLAAVIGVAAQRAENIKSKAASDTLRRQYNELAERNDKTLNQVGRSLESLGDTITIQYVMRVPIKVGIQRALAANIVSRAKKALGNGDQIVPFGVVADNHTNLSIDAEDSKHTTYKSIFDESSSVIPKKPPLIKAMLSDSLFNVYIFKEIPRNDSACSAQPEDIAEASYHLDKTLTGARESGDFLFHTFKNPIWRYNSNENFFTLSSNTDVVYRLHQNKGRMLSALDVQRKYLVIGTLPNFGIDFLGTLHVKIGQHYIDADMQNVKSDSCGFFAYRIPDFDISVEK